MRARFGAFLLSLFVLIPTSVFALNIPPEDSTQQDSHCRNEWTKRGVLDQGMYNYCVNLQKEGYAKFRELSDKYKNATWIQETVDFALDKWTKRGVRDDEMVAYELGLQIDAFENLVYEAKQKGFDQSKYERCYQLWNIQFTQLEYCYKND
jgi:hypothetical protein